MASYTSLCPATGNADLNTGTGATERIGVSAVFDTPTNLPYVASSSTITSVTASFRITSGTGNIGLKCEIFAPSGSSPTSLGVLQTQTFSMTSSFADCTFTGSIDTSSQGTSGIQIAFIVTENDGGKFIQIENNDAGCTSDTGAGQSYYLLAGTFDNYKTDSVPLTVVYTLPVTSGGTRLPPPPLIARF